MLSKYSSTPMFMIVFGIHCNFFIVLCIQLKTCRSNVFFFSTRQHVRAWKIWRVSEVLRARSTPGAQFVCVCIFACVWMRPKWKWDVFVCFVLSQPLSISSFYSCRYSYSYNCKVILVFLFNNLLFLAIKFYFVCVHFFLLNGEIELSN